jgi:hypothetical protein
MRKLGEYEKSRTSERNGKLSAHREGALMPSIDVNNVATHSLD